MRNLISQQDGIKAAYFVSWTVIARCRRLSTGHPEHQGATAFGNGNGQIEATAASVNSSTAQEDLAVWEHLSRAGFINGAYTSASTYTNASAPTILTACSRHALRQRLCRRGHSDGEAQSEDRQSDPGRHPGRGGRKIDDGMRGWARFGSAAFPPPARTRLQRAATMPACGK